MQLLCYQKPWGELFGIDGNSFKRQYHNHHSGYKEWDQLSHAEDWILYLKNIGAYIGIDEVALSQGELYTVILDKAFFLFRLSKLYA